MGIPFSAGKIFCCRGRKHLAVQRGALSWSAERLADLFVSGKPGTGIILESRVLHGGHVQGEGGLFYRHQQWD